jgi:hypothetical protein
MTLGCGGWGGNITSDNISPKHLLNIKRVAYETTPAKGLTARVSSDPRPAQPTAPKAGLTPEVLSQRIDQFLASKGISPDPDRVGSGQVGSGQVGSGLSRTATIATTTTSPSPDRPAQFVCEDDVRQALKSGHKILLDSRTIVTPAARDLGEEKRVFIESH